jgi:transcriptional/translational regulatory protein YebC/TACO1
MAGHSKWKQIKHKKAAADAKRGALFAKHARAITAAVRAASGNLDSPNVVTHIERAKAADMPKENIERAVLKATGAALGELENLIFETYGPGGVACIIIATTDSRNRTVQELKHILSEFECVLGSAGAALWAFTKQEDGSYTPHTTIPVLNEDRERLAALLEVLYEYNDVESVYTNSESL